MGLPSDCRAMMPRLRAARAGDEAAQSDVSLFVFKKYKGQVQGYYTSAYDAAYDRDDIDQTFYLGIVQALAVVHPYRGNPFAYMAYRGVSRVKSFVTAISNKPRLATVSLDGGYHQDGEPQMLDAADRADALPHDIVIDQLDAEQRVVGITANATVTGRAEEILAMLLAGEIDPTDPGYNKELAKRLGVSQQRGSQLMGKLRKQLSAEAL